MNVAFILLPNRKLNKFIPVEQKRFWKAQWLGRLKNSKASNQMEKIIGVPFDQPEIPYTALYLLGILRGCGNVEISIIDLWASGVNEINIEKVREKISNAKADVFLFSPFTNNYSFAKKCLTEIKKQNPSSICIIGGHHASFCAEECITDGFDYVIHGRGESALLNLVAANWKNQKKIIHELTSNQTVKAVWHNNLPVFDLLPECYKKTYYARLFTTHGCPFKCVFCSNTVWHGMKPILMPLYRIRQEITLIQKYIEFEEIYVNDENFTLVQEHFKPLSQLLYEKNLKWGCETRIDLIDKHKLNQLSITGCKEIDYGLESLDKGVLINIKKDIDIDDVYRVFSETAGTGIRCHVNLMVGLPGETITSALSTIDTVCRWIEQGIISTVDYFITVPYPGTDLFENASQYGIDIITDKWDAYREDSIPVFNHKILSAQQIYSCWKNGLNKLADTLEMKWNKKI